MAARVRLRATVRVRLRATVRFMLKASTHLRFNNIHRTGQVDGPWESNSVFGNAKDNKDFKSEVFSNMPKDQIMVLSTVCVCVLSAP